MQLENVCDETGLGDNSAECNNDSADNVIGYNRANNDAKGSGDADFTQNNNIPTINQVIEQRMIVTNQMNSQLLDLILQRAVMTMRTISIDSITQTNDAQVPMSMIFSRTIQVHFLKS